MDEKPNEIRNRIDLQRNRLGENIDELERRVKDTTDVKAHFERHPMMAVGLAFGGGLLLSGMVAGGRSSGRSRRRREVSEYDRSGNASGTYNPSSRYSPSSSYSSGRYSGSEGSSYYGPKSQQWGSESGDYGSRSQQFSSSQSSSWLQNSEIGKQKDRALETLDRMGAAFIALAADRLKDFLDEAMPGFKQRLSQDRPDSRGSGDYRGQSAGRQQHGSSYYDERGSQGQQGGFYGDRGSQWSGRHEQGGQSRPHEGSEGSRQNWSTEPANEGSYTNQGGWSGSSNRPRSASMPSEGHTGTANPTGETHQTSEDRSKTSAEHQGSVQQDQSGSSYRK